MAVLSALARRTVGLLAGLTVLLAFAYGGLLAAGYKPVAVYSGSMSPRIPVGAVAFEKPVASSSIRVGDVITFADPYVAGRVVTHRVVAVRATRQGPAYRTKGDANPARDPWTIRLPSRVGRVSFSVPYVGYVLVYSHTREVRGLLIGIGASLLLGYLLTAIWRSPRVEAAA